MPQVNSELVDKAKYGAIKDDGILKGDLKPTHAERKDVINQMRKENKRLLGSINVREKSP